MLKPTVKLNKNLWKRIERCAKISGYSSSQEFIEHVLEREVAKREEEDQSSKEIVKKLKGLGYLD